MLKKVEFMFGRFRDTPTSLDEEVFVVGSMSVISAGGFENRLSRILELSHNVHFSIKSGLDSRKDLSLEAKAWAGLLRVFLFL